MKNSVTTVTVEVNRSYSISGNLRYMKKDVGENIRARRTAAGLSYAQLAERMAPHAQCTRQAIKKWEDGSGELIGLPYLRALAIALRCRVSDLIGETESDAQLKVSEIASAHNTRTDLSELVALFDHLTDQQQAQELERLRNIASENAAILRKFAERPITPSMSGQSVPLESDVAAKYPDLRPEMFGSGNSIKRGQKKHG